jgi:predicted NBD/HSP70 family sugar kinase
MTGRAKNFAQTAKLRGFSRLIGRFLQAFTMRSLNLDQIRARNRRIVLQCIREAGAIARVEIAGLVDVSPATVSVVTRELLLDGLIEAVDQDFTDLPAGRGRPKTLLRLRSNAAHAIGIKLTLHQAAVSVTNFVGDVLASETVPMPPEERTPERLIDLCEQQIQAILKLSKIEPAQLLGVGIGFPGCIDFRTGTVDWSPMFDDRNVPLKSALQERTGLRIVVDNEANLAGLAEKWFGLGRAYPSFVLVTVEHGVGMAIVINHQIYRGSRGFAGEFGHTKIEIDGADCRCGKTGCVEAYVADYAIVREAAELIGRVPIRDQRAVQEALGILASRADSGDPQAAAIFERAGRILGIALANAVNLFDPPVIIMSGQRAMHPARIFIESMKASLADRVLTSASGIPPVEIHPWGDDLWARGAAALVLEEFMPTNSLSRQLAGSPDPISKLAADTTLEG